MSNARSRVVGARRVNATPSTILRNRAGKDKMHPDGAVVSTKEEGFITKKLRGNSPPNSYREGEYLHVSDVLGKCMRAIALSKRTGVRIAGETIGDSMAIVFEMGRAAQRHITGKILMASPDQLYGDWKCRCKAKSFTGTATQAKAQPSCNKCLGALEDYGEIVLRNEELKLVGSVDITLLMDGAFYLTESKSIAPEHWKELQRPKPDHVIQVVFYWWLAHELGMPLHSQVSIIYINKGYVFGNPYKEFVIQPEDHLHRLEEYKEEAKALKQSTEGGPLPTRTCTTMRSPVAKKCELCTICFSV